MFKKKILSAVIATSMLCAALPAYAYDSADYHAKADELKTLIEECKELGINTQYEEIDANIIEVYADRIAKFQSDGLSSSIANFQLTELDSLYTNAKANLEAYKSGTKEAPAEVYDYETGDGYEIDGASLKNVFGDSYFSAGFGHFNLTGYMDELGGYGYDNVQVVTSFESAITADRKIDGWDTANSGNADVTYEMVNNMGRSNNTSLHVVNNSAQASNVYGTMLQRVPVKPNTEYEISFYVKGEKAKYATMYSVNDWESKQWIGYGKTGYDDWTKMSMTFTAGSDEYFKNVRFFFEDTCDLYIDDIVIKKTGSNHNAVVNGGFDGDGSDDFDIYYGVNSTLHETLKTLNAAEKNNMHVEVLLQLQQGMPGFITDKYPEIGGDGRYNIDHAVAQNVEKAYIESVLGVMADYDSLGSIIVANEPSYNAADYSYSYDTKFASYLEKKHGTISALNSAYGKSYSSFAKVGIPSAYENSARFYDWKEFNDNIFATWYEKTVDIIKDCIPGIPVSLKAQPDVVGKDSSESTRPKHMTRGLNMEILGEISDFHGNDSYAYYEEEGSLRSTMMWYDYLNSINEKPIYDSEKHITIDQSSKYNTDITNFTKQTVWQSMIHGLDMYSIWTWDTGVDTSSVRYGHLTLRPGALSEVAKAGLDANRLSDEVTAFANATPTVAILRSDATRIYNDRYMHTMSRAYNAANEAGHKVGFVTTRNIESALSDYEILVIPYATNVEANVINAIAGFKGKIVMLDSDSLKKNQYNQSYSGDMLTKVNQIISKATVIETANSYTNSYEIRTPSKDTVKQALAQTDGVSVSSYDNLEWQYVPYKNGYLVNISNYDYSTARNVSISIDGSAASYITSAIDNQDVTSISLPKMTSGLYYVRNVDDDFIEKEEEEVFGVDEIITLDASRKGTKNTLTWRANAGVYNVYNVNPDGTLSFITSTEDKKFTETSDGAKTYAVKFVKEDGESKGKKITCGFDVDEVSVRTTRNGFAIDYTNNESHSVAVTITATGYNEDDTFKKAAVVELLIPAGKTVNYKKVLDASAIEIIKK